MVNLTSALGVPARKLQVSAIDFSPDRKEVPSLYVTGTRAHRLSTGTGSKYLEMIMQRPKHSVNICQLFLCSKESRPDL